MPWSKVHHITDLPNLITMSSVVVNPLRSVDKLTITFLVDNTIEWLAVSYVLSSGLTEVTLIVKDDEIAARLHS